MEQQGAGEMNGQQVNMEEPIVLDETKKESVEKIKIESTDGIIWTTGRRKTSIARVKLQAGTGKFTIKGVSLDKYFGGHKKHISVILETIGVFKDNNKYDITVQVVGGGLTGQAGAIRLAIARAVSKLVRELRPKLKEMGALRRDPRMVERKKSGQPKARKKFQWTKR